MLQKIFVCNMLYPSEAQGCLFYAKNIVAKEEEFKYICIPRLSPGGGIGRRVGLKHQ